MSRTSTYRPADGHPFRRGLRIAWLRRRMRGRPARLTAQDLREFLMAYCACFMAVSAFIA